MTSKLDSLRSLHEAVKAGTLPEAVFHGSSSIRGHWAYLLPLDTEQRRKVYLAYNGSLDAAHALHRAVLPGWGWCSATDAHDEQWFSVSESSGDYETEEVYAATPARAWLLSILSALIAQEEAGVIQAPQKEEK